MAREHDAALHGKKQPGIWKTSFVALSQCWGSSVIVAILMLGLVFWQMVGPFSGQVYVIFLLGLVIWGYFALSLFGWLLSGCSSIVIFKEIDKSRVRRFFGRYLVLQVIDTLPSSLTSLVLTGHFLLSPVDMVNNANLAAVGISSIATFAVLWIVLVFFATLLPAALVGDGSGVRRAVARGRKTVWYVTSRLLLGPLLMLLLGSMIVNLVQTVGGEPMISSDGALVVNTTSVIAMVISSLQFIVVVAMIAVIVSRAYKLGEARLLKTDKQNEEIASEYAV
ncbi:hypothetical protein [Thalassospira sp. ER-Se-21-Dark]|uniref:hypothetical protein n=1 Tax=Thalassospira sp. ER-Se-21-Dark TaxID=2585190 RepID=UPI001B316D3C|nr:hypothetical protein [Thalassospira sp. ER-Se-21-Dark]MBP3127385.1 hypothetical protein [Thalassospira sp. ER-Se-21-Dark]